METDKQRLDSNDVNFGGLSHYRSHAIFMYNRIQSIDDILFTDTTLTAAASATAVVTAPAVSPQGINRPTGVGVLFCDAIGIGSLCFFWEILTCVIVAFSPHTESCLPLNPNHECGQ